MKSPEDNSTKPPASVPTDPLTPPEAAPIPDAELRQRFKDATLKLKWLEQEPFKATRDVLPNLVRNSDDVDGDVLIPTQLGRDTLIAQKDAIKVEFCRKGFSREDIKDLEAQILKEHKNELLQPGSDDAAAGLTDAPALQPEPTRKVKPPTPHEKAILEVSQRGLKGKQYLRELHNANARPRQSWIDRGCPGTYAGIAAERDPKWPQRAADEKTKVCKKFGLLSH